MAERTNLSREERLEEERKSRFGKIYDFFVSKRVAKPNLIDVPYPAGETQFEPINTITSDLNEKEKYDYEKALRPELNARLKDFNRNLFFELENLKPTQADIFRKELVLAPLRDRTKWLEKKIMDISLDRAPAMAKRR